MNTRYRSRSRWIKLGWITLVWICISVFQFLNGYALLLQRECPLEGQSVLLPFTGSLLTGLLAGLFGGSIIIFLWERWLRTRPYGWTIVNIFVTYSITYLAVSIPTNLYYLGNQLRLAPWDSRVWAVIFERYTKLWELQSYFFWMVVVLATLIVLLVNDKYGPGVFRDFLLGKYFHPKREERIFMFLDLRSSTTIAEQLGEVRYFQFIKDVFQTATPSILATRGEIYQYVGDEIIVSWKMDRGVENANCLQCFFLVGEAIRSKKRYFEEAYGIQPEFKAGLHYGHVMAGEIGIVKRDIAFSGDVLNTAARIQSKCNDLGVNILLSKQLLDQIHPGRQRFSPRELGQIELRGKAEKVILVTV